MFKEIYKNVDKNYKKCIIKRMSCIYSESSITSIQLSSNREKSKRIKKNIQFPIFIEAAKLCDDDYWKQIISDMAYGKLPKSTFLSLYDNVYSSYKQPILIYKGNGSNIRITIKSTEPLQLKEEIIKILKTYGNLSSEMDNKNKLMSLYNALNLDKKKKKTKNDYISIKLNNYINNTFDSNVLRKKYLDMIIFLNFMGYIKPEDYVYDTNEEIKYIDLSKILSRIKKI